MTMCRLQIQVEVPATGVGAAAANPEDSSDDTEHLASAAHHQDANEQGIAHPPPVMRDPQNWRSEDEAFFRMGVWTGMGPSKYVASPQGGSQVFREVPHYGIDARNHIEWDQCTKHKTPSSSHLPGIMAHWCLKCSKCILISLMETAECSRTPADLLIAFYDVPPDLFSYDNG